QEGRVLPRPIDRAGRVDPLDRRPAAGRHESSLAARNPGRAVPVLERDLSFEDGDGRAFLRDLEHELRALDPGIDERRVEAQRLRIAADRVQRALDELDDDIEPRLSLVLDGVYPNGGGGIDSDERTFGDANARSAERAGPYGIAVAERVAGLQKNPTFRRFDLNDTLGSDDDRLPAVDADAMVAGVRGSAGEDTEQRRYDQSEEYVTLFGARNVRTSRPSRRLRRGQCHPGTLVVAACEGVLPSKADAGMQRYRNRAPLPSAAQSKGRATRVKQPPRDRLHARGEPDDGFHSDESRGT